MLHNHLETYFSAAVLDGCRHAAVEELIDAVTPVVTGPQAQLSGAAVGEPIGAATVGQRGMTWRPRL